MTFEAPNPAAHFSPRLGITTMLAILLSYMFLSTTSGILLGPSNCPLVSPATPGFYYQFLSLGPVQPLHLTSLGSMHCLPQALWSRHSLLSSFALLFSGLGMPFLQASMPIPGPGEEPAKTCSPHPAFLGHSLHMDLPFSFLLMSS